MYGMNKAASLKALRERRDFTQAEMGARLGIEAETVSSYERGVREISAPVWKLIQLIGAARAT